MKERKPEMPAKKKVRATRLRNKPARSSIKSPKELSIKKEFDPKWFKRKKASLFIGNGFNYSIGVKTSYKAIFKRLDKIEIVQNALSAASENYAEEIKENNYDLEYALEGSHNSKDIPCKEFVRREFYRAILHICQYKKITTKALGFFKYFDRYFTTNFDPLLFRFLETHKQVESPKQFRKTSNEIKKIKKRGAINVADYNPLELSTLSSATQREVAGKITKASDNSKLDSEDVRTYFEKDGAENKFLSCGDGFDELDKRRAIWKKGNKDQKLFYLHGGLHMYKENGETYRFLIPSPGVFISRMLQKFKDNLCVFEGAADRKKAKVDDSCYLRDCRSALNNTAGLLCIIGWDCNERDNHLFASGHKFRKIYVGICGLEDEVKEYEKGEENILSRYSNLLGAENLVFFDSATLPYVEEDKAKKC